jgi:hypothetical protein
MAIRMIGPNANITFFGDGVSTQLKVDITDPPINLPVVANLPVEIYRSLLSGPTSPTLAVSLSGKVVTLNFSSAPEARSVNNDNQYSVELDFLYDGK